MSYYDKLRNAVLGIVRDDDEYKEPKHQQLLQWCSAFLYLFDSYVEERLPFFLDVLSDEACWQQCDKPHCIKFLRRKVAEEMVALESWRGTKNPLDLRQRYDVACRCCLDEKIIELFNEFSDLSQRQSDVGKQKIRSLVERTGVNEMTVLWTHWMTDEDTIQVNIPEDKFSMVHALDTIVDKWRTHVEAVEYIWDLLEQLPDCVVLFPEGRDLTLNKSALIAADRNFACDVFEYCFSRLRPDMYPGLLKTDLTRNACFDKLFGAFRFDYCRKLFDCVEASSLSVDRYRLWLLSIKFSPDYYVEGGLEFLMHMWTKEGFDRHRNFTLAKEMFNYSDKQGELLVFLVQKNFMEAVWAILDELLRPTVFICEAEDDSHLFLTGRELFQQFLKCRQADVVVEILKRDQDSLIRFYSYQQEQKKCH